MIREMKQSISITITIGLMVLIVACFASACQPTPEKAAVIGRQDDILAIITPVSPEEFEEMQAPAHVSGVYDFARLSIIFDADVVVPKTIAYPVVKVSKRVFSDEEYLSLIERFAGANDELYSEWNLSKSEWMDKIVKITPHVNSGIVIQDTLDYWQEEYDSADEEAINPLVEISELPDYATPLYVKTQYNRAAQVAIIRNGNYFVYVKDTFLYTAPASSHKDSDYHEDFDTLESFRFLQPGEPEISQEEAYQQALAYVEELDMGLELYSAEPCSVIIDQVEKSVGWRFIFTRKISGLQVPYQDFVASINPDSLPSYAAPWEMEMCRMVIDKTGICTIKWQGASMIGDVAAQSVALEPFDFIQSRIVDQFKYNQGKPIRDDVGIDIKITKIELGTSLISVKDEYDTGLYIPTWYVDYHMKWSDVDEYDNEICTVIFSAIDGSYIEPRVTNKQLMRNLP